jgi:hypothetical protein
MRRKENCLSWLWFFKNLHAMSSHMYDQMWEHLEFLRNSHCMCNSRWVAWSNNAFEKGDDLWTTMLMHARYLCLAMCWEFLVMVMMGALACNLYYNLVGYICSSKKSTYILTLLASLTLMQTFKYKTWKHGMWCNNKRFTWIQL